MPKPIGKMHEMWFGEETPSAPVAAEPEPEYVWARVGNAKLKRVRKDVAEAEGMEIDTREVKFEVPASNTYRLSVEERERIYWQTGRRVEDYANLKRYYRENGLRDEEKGEGGREKKDLIREWVAAGSPGECPAGRHGLKVKPRPGAGQFMEYIARKKANA